MRIPVRLALALVFAPVLAGNQDAQTFVSSYVAINSVGGFVSRLFDLRGKVKKQEVEELIQASGMVREVVIKGESDSVAGTVLVAHVVPTEAEFSDVRWEMFSAVTSRGAIGVWPMSDKSRKTEAILFAALEKPVEEQAGFLEEACGNDPTMR